jgi:hypothetical protein
MASFSSLPTVTATFSLELSLSVAADINTHWLSQRVGSPGTLQAAIDLTETALRFTPGAGLLGAGFVSLEPGQTIVIGSEAMTVTAIYGEQLTVVRNVVPLSVPAEVHAAGEAIYLLKYAQPWALIADEALRPWAQSVVAALGPRSATFGARATGSIAVTVTP